MQEDGGNRGQLGEERGNGEIIQAADAGARTITGLSGSLHERLGFRKSSFTSGDVSNAVGSGTTSQWRNPTMTTYLGRMEPSRPRGDFRLLCQQVSLRWFPY